MDMINIIKLELSNRCYIYLYPYKSGAWGCCRCSAELLHQLYPNIYYSEKPVAGWGDAFPVVIIDSMSLEHLIENLPPKEQNGEKIVIEVPDAYLSCLR